MRHVEPVRRLDDHRLDRLDRPDRTALRVSDVPTDTQASATINDPSASSNDQKIILQRSTYCELNHDAQKANVICSRASSPGAEGTADDVPGQRAIPIQPAMAVIARSFAGPAPATRIAAWAAAGEVLVSDGARALLGSAFRLAPRGEFSGDGARLHAVVADAG